MRENEREKLHERVRVSERASEYKSERVREVESESISD